jgi:hypothetical protein
MAGKLLPLALATVSGISIGIATFGPELKEQRKKKLTDDYNRDVAAAAALNTEGLPPIVPTAIQTPADEDQGNPTTSSWSSMLGLWAWKKNPKHDATPAALAAPAVAQEAPVKTAIQRTDEKA